MKQGPQVQNESIAANLSLLCRMRSHLCALPLERVVETMRPMPITALAGVLPFVLGMAVIRGVAIPVVDAGALLGSARHAAPTRFVTLKMQGRQIALAVEEVLGVRPIAATTLHDLPPLLRSAGADLVSAVGLLDSELLMLLQTARIVPESTWQALQAAQQA